MIVCVGAETRKQTCQLAWVLRILCASLSRDNRFSGNHQVLDLLHRPIRSDRNEKQRYALNTNPITFRRKL